MMTDCASASPDPKCIASTNAVYQCPTRESHRREAKALKFQDGGDVPDQSWEAVELKSSHEESNYFKSAQWSPDGTCILTSSQDNRLRTFVLPADLLDERSSPSQLLPYSIIISPEPVYATCIYPHFDLQDPSTTVHLSSPRGLPVTLHSSLHPTRLSTYTLVHGPTEKYLTPHSLLFRPSGTHFLAGSDSVIALFDVSRDGSGPVSQFATIPSKRKKLVGGGVGMKGIVSGMAISVDGILAAGTFTRNVGLYDAEGSGNCIAVFSLAGGQSPPTDSDAEPLQREGTGITQVLWSPCGRYLYIAERQSDAISAYDVRVAGKKVASLTGRNAETNQRLGVDMVAVSNPAPPPSASPSDSNSVPGHEIWAGGVDGMVRFWRGGANATQPACEWMAHGDPVTSTIVHPSGSVVATCSGQRRSMDEGDGDSSPPSSTAASDANMSAQERGYDNTLKIWRL